MIKHFGIPENFELLEKLYDDKVFWNNSFGGHEVIRVEESVDNKEESDSFIMIFQIEKPLNFSSLEEVYEFGNPLQKKVLTWLLVSKSRFVISELKDKEGNFYMKITIDLHEKVPKHIISRLQDLKSLVVCIKKP